MPWHALIRSLIYPGLLSALLAGGLCRGIAAWLGAHWDRRPAPPVWQPLAELGHLVGKAWAGGSSRPPALAAWPALPALATLSWALGTLPWPWLASPVVEPFPGYLWLYPALLLVAPMARLVAAGLSAKPSAAIGAWRQAPLEIARLLPLVLAAVALPLMAGSAEGAPADEARGLIHVAATAILLATLPWPLWDRHRYEAPLSALGGRPLALFRMVEALELLAQMGLAIVTLEAGGLLPAGRPWLSTLVVLAAAIVLLTVFEKDRRQLPLDTAVRRYTRWLLPLAVVVALLAWLSGRFNL